RQQQFYSNANIDKLVEERIASKEKQSLALKKHFFEAKPKQISQVDPNTKAIRQFIKIMKRAKKTLTKKPGPAKKKADKIHIDCFLNEILENIDDDPNSKFRSLSVFKHHLKLKNKCSLVNNAISITSDQVSLTSDQVSLTSDQVSSTSNRISLTIDRVSPKSDQVSPTSDQISPESDQISKEKF
ncbi:30551_t:CDS:2, partial [Gigaspora margarita]